MGVVTKARMAIIMQHINISSQFAVYFKLTPCSMSNKFEKINKQQWERKTKPKTAAPIYPCPALLRGWIEVLEKILSPQDHGTLMEKHISPEDSSLLEKAILLSWKVLHGISREKGDTHAALHTLMKQIYNRGEQTDAQPYYLHLANLYSSSWPFIKHS